MPNQKNNLLGIIKKKKEECFSTKKKKKINQELHLTAIKLASALLKLLK